MALTFPIGYGTLQVGLSSLRRLHAHPDRAPHPEFWRRLEAALIWNNSRADRPNIGIGGGWRTTPHPVSYASRMGWSFHQDQRFASGHVGYSAVDLVVARPPFRHRSPTWAEVEFFDEFGLHAFINNEPWHVQCHEMRGYWRWRRAGRPDPDTRFPLPGENLDMPPTVTPTSSIRECSNAALMLRYFCEQQRIAIPAVLGGYSHALEVAIRTFQRKRGLTDDGIVGPVTWVELFGMEG